MSIELGAEIKVKLGEHMLGVRRILPRLYRRWAREHLSIRAFESKRVADERKALVDVPGHPCHLDQYVSNQGEDEHAAWARAVLEDCLVSFDGQGGDGIIDLIDAADLLILAGLAAMQAQVPSEEEKKS